MHTSVYRQVLSLFVPIVLTPCARCAGRCRETLSEAIAGCTKHTVSKTRSKRSKEVSEHDQ